MRLLEVHVKMFRNILDSSPVSIQNDVTCLVGKNESGKTAFLQALWRLNPARRAPAFSIPDDYPAWLEKRHRLEGRNLEDVAPIRAHFEWQDADIAAVDEAFGPGVAPKNSKLTLSRTYGNQYVWTHGCNEAKAVANLIARRTLPKAVGVSLKAAQTFDELPDRIAEQAAASAEIPETLGELQQLSRDLAELIGDDDFADALWTVLKPRVPLFLYFADYSKLPYTAKINHVLTAGDDALSESEATARALLRLGGAEQEYLLNPDYERRTRELENVANALTDDVLKYWSQNNQLRVRPDISQRTETGPKGATAVLDELKTRIWDNRHSLSLPFDQHSAGFQWFFSFLAAFSEFEHRDPPVVILLDEPAVGLHARAQADFLRFIEERLTARCQVIYTTHSPFMVQPGRLERVRLVEDRSTETGAVVTSEVLTRDADTLFPLQGALGYDLVQHLFVHKHNLVVEGTSDFTYISLLSSYLGNKEGRSVLDPRWSIVPVGGADAIPTFVALLGTHLDVTVLVDSRKAGHQRLTQMQKDGFLKDKRIVMIGDIVGAKIADIEDLFAPEEYLMVYNEAFGSNVKVSDLKGKDPIVQQIARVMGVERYDHGRPADVLLRQREVFLPQLTEDTLKRFELLFERVNATFD